MKSKDYNDKEIIDLVCNGFVAKEIAVKLNCTPEHVEYRILKIRAIHGAKNIPHLLFILFEKNRTQAQQ